MARPSAFTVALLVCLATSASAVAKVEFGLYDLDATPPGGWRLVADAELLARGDYLGEFAGS